MRNTRWYVAALLIGVSACAYVHVSAREAVVVRIGGKEEALGVIDKTDHGSESMIFHPVYMDGYCRRSVVSLSEGDKKPRMEIGRAMSASKSWFEYALAADATKCDGDTKYFEPAISAPTKLSDVEGFLTSLHAWRSGAAPARFEFHGASPEALNCARQEPALQVSILWDYYLNDGSERKAYTVKFDGCTSPDSADPLWATVTRDRNSGVPSAIFEFDSGPISVD